MKPTLQEIEGYLQENKNHLVGIFDQTGTNQLEKDVSNDTLVSKHGGFIPFLQNLYTRGVTTVYIEKVKKRGSVVQFRHAAFEYKLKAKEGTMTEKSTLNASTSSQENSASFGLTGPEYITHLKQKNKKLKSKLKAFNDKPGLTGQVTELMSNEALMGNIGMIISTLKPTKTENDSIKSTGSAQKDTLVQLLFNPQVTDDHAKSAYLVLDRIMKGDQTFADLIVGLLNEK